MRFQLLWFSVLSSMCFCASTIAFNLIWPTLSVTYQNSLVGPLELSNASEFSLKAKQARHNDGLRLALIGDSFIYSKTMAESIGPDWREETLDKHLSACLKNDVSVTNFGLNGLLPMDIETMTSTLLEDNFDYVLFNINNRSVSEDFNYISKVHSRAWIANKPEKQWSLLAKFNLLKRAIYNEGPDEWGNRLAQKFADFFVVNDETDSFPNISMSNLVQLKSRYKTASFDIEISEQANSLQRVLSNPRVLAFRTVENKYILDSIIETKARERLDFELTELIRSADAEQRVLKAPENLVSSDFIDFMHVTGTGQRKYADALCPQLAALF